MKTIKEIRVAVHKECERLCNGGEYANYNHIPIGIQVKPYGFDVSYGSYCTPNPTIEVRQDDTMEGDARILYVLFGLSERDAVEAMKKELQKTNILANESIHAREVHIRKITSEFEARLNMMDAKQGKYMGLYRDSEARVTKLLEAAKAVISESEKEYAVTTMSEVAMLSDGFEQAIANLDAVLSELEKGGAGE